MSDEDLKAIITMYQQKSFELFNQNIVLETQINSLKKTVDTLTTEVEKLKKTKRGVKPEEDFN